MKKNSGYNEILRHENEITKLKIQAEFGLELNGNEKLNPSIENIWLNQILEYERGMINNKKITVGELLEHPFCKPIEEISDDNLIGELQKVMELLQLKNIVVESIDGIDDHEMYRFITQELFLAETDSALPKNVIVCFIYEEFHPNDESDIKRCSTDFVKALIKKEKDYYELFIYSGEDEEKEIISQNLKRRISLFRDAYDEIILEEFNITSLNVMEINSEVFFTFRLAVLPSESKKFQYISGNGTFFFIKEYDYWSIEEAVMKGIV